MLVGLYSNVLVHYKCMNEWKCYLDKKRIIDATYQKTMNLIFHNMINYNTKVYIDYIMVKSKSKSTNMMNYVLLLNICE